MNLQQLKILVLISKYKKITTVAEILKLKQPTVTFHMKKLEQSTEVPLFLYRHKMVILTDAGEALLHYASRIVTWANEAEQALLDYRHFNKGKIIVGASNTSATYFLPKLLGKMRQAYPHVHIVLQVKNSPQLIEMLKRFEIDFGLVAEHQIDDPDLVVTPLMDDELGLVVHPNHPLVKADLIVPNFLEKEIWIMREQDSATRRMTEVWAKMNEIKFKTTLELGATEAIKRAIIGNLGISILSRLAVEEEIKHRQLVFKSLHSAALGRKIFFIYNRNRYITPIIKEYIRFFTEKEWD